MEQHLKEKRLKHVIKKKDRLFISKRRRRSSSNTKKNLKQIPDDLIFEILSKLPVKSIARFRCVSKHWNSIIRSSDFTNLFLKVSSSHPRILFTVKVRDKLHFYSAPQPLNTHSNSSSLTIDYHMSFPLSQYSTNLYAPVNGLRGCNESKVMIYNPSTRQSIPLPIMKGRQRNDATIFLGYDPINKQYKVLCISSRMSVVNKHEVLILGIEKSALRTIECSLPRYFPCYPLCINGVLYYLGIHGPYRNETIIVCFDVRSEKFKSIEATDKVKRYPSRLINYKGKLGVLTHACSINSGTKSIDLLVLNDVEKNEWSQHIYVLPPLWKDLAVGIAISIVGMTDNGELVFSSDVCGPFYLFFYNLEKNTIARVRIQGMETIERQCIQTFIDHVENVKLMWECSEFQKTSLISVLDCLDSN